MDLLIFFGSCLACLVLAYGCLWYQSLKSLPPGPWGLPVLGYLLWIDKKEPQKTVQQLSRRYGRIFSLSMGSLFTVVITDPQLVREALARDVFSERANLFLTHGIMKGNGIIAANGRKWREQRRFLTSFLKNAGMLRIGVKRDQMQNRILVGVSAACEMFSRSAEPTDPLKVLIHTMGNVMNELLFGISYPEGDPQWEYLQELAVEGVKLIGVAGPLNFLPFLRFLPSYKKTVKYIIEGQKKTHEEYKSISDRQADNPDQDTLLHQFKKEMSSGKGEFFTEEQMHFLLADMFGAGVETAMTTLRWFLLYMAANNDIQDRVFEELLHIMGNREVPNLADLPGACYLEACMSETQRIRPVVPLGIPHGAREETELCGYRIPQGSMILIPQYVLHMDPDAWKDPESFDPKRFLDETGRVFKDHSHFMPFQSGKRVCIGEEMARMMLFLFGAGILRRFNVSLPQNADLPTLLKGDCGITWAPQEHGLIFTPRPPTAQ